MEIIRKGEAKGRALKYGDIVEYSNTDICIISQSPKNTPMLTALRNGRLIRSFESLEHLNSQAGINFICENEEVVIMLPSINN